jgi:hypothetical protein
MLASRVARFFLVQTYQNGKKCTKGPQTAPNGQTVYQITAHYFKWLQNVPTFSIPRHLKYTRIGIFGLKINHLATLLASQIRISISQKRSLEKV